MASNPSKFSATGEKKPPAGMKTSTHPVEQVSWDDATEFCTKLNQKDKLATGYRLPTEAEWEFACRAGTVTKYWAGDKDDDLLQSGWLQVNSGNGTHVAGGLKANPFGLYDTSGNVWEWVEDWWEPTYYEQFTTQPATNPHGASSSPQSLRIVRGGTFIHPASCGRSAFRYSQKVTDRYEHIGFRAALSVEAVRAALESPPAVKKAK